MTTIEPLARTEFEAAASWLSDPRINRWLSAEWRGRSIDATTLAIAIRQKRNQLFCVRHQGEPCGLVALSEFDPTDRSAMVWYLLGRAELGGGGIMSEAVRSLLAVAFTALDLNAVYAWAMEPNAASIRLLEKAGFHPAGCLRLTATLDGQPVHRRYFDITRAEWLASPSVQRVAPALAAR